MLCRDGEVSSAFSGSALLSGGPTAGGDAPAGAGETPALRLSPLGSADEVDVAAFDVYVDQLHVDTVADVDSMRAVDDLALNRRVEDSHPCSLLRGAGDDSVETLADARLEDAGRGRLANLPLHLVR